MIGRSCDLECVDHDYNCGRSSLIRVLVLPRSPRATPYSSNSPTKLSRASTMDTKSQQMKGGDAALSSLNSAIETLDLAEQIARIDPPAEAVFGSVSAVLTIIRVPSLLVCVVGRLHAEIDLGHNNRRGRLRRTWADLR